MKDESKPIELEVSVIDFQRLKAQSLDHYESFNIHRCSDHLEVKRAVDHIYDELNALSNSKHNRRIWVRHIEVSTKDF